VGALGFAVLANTRSILSAWIVIALHGFAMALSLYETCFAALSQRYPNDYRRAVTFVTLLGGLASSMFWPATHYLLSNAGWRLTSRIYALALIAAALLNAAALSAPGLERRERAAIDRGHAPLPGRARGLIAAFAGASFVSAALAAHLPGTLTALHVEAAHAVWIAALVGVMQVAGRALELAVGRRLSAARLGLLTFAGVLASLLLLIASDGHAALALAFALVYGAANGVMTIVGATIPSELFGTRQLGLVLGRFAAPSRVTRAIAPLAFSAVAAPFGSWYALVWTAGVAAASCAMYTRAVRAS
ncbi:MAG TPA: hypothetical protein VJR89_15675, partial [Polyangiales bacterium]|nr:hypothetical protein [Polyangiales bacterium]